MEKERRGRNLILIPLVLLKIAHGFAMLEKVVHRSNMLKAPQKLAHAVLTLQGIPIYIRTRIDLMRVVIG
jgi:hypothetical protein